MLRAPSAAEDAWPDGTMASFDDTQFGDDIFVTIRYPDTIESE